MADKNRTADGLNPGGLSPAQADEVERKGSDSTASPDTSAPEADDNIDDKGRNLTDKKVDPKRHPQTRQGS